MPSNRDVFLDWIRKADGDYRTARREFKVFRQPNYDAACYHAQQCAEKYLKGFLVLNGKPYLRTHFLNRVLEDCLLVDPSFEFIRHPCEEITGIDDIRYPSEFATKEDATIALDAMTVIRKFIRAKIGLK